MRVRLDCPLSAINVIRCTAEKLRASACPLCHELNRINRIAPRLDSDQRGSIALINAVGNLGGYVGPFIVGWIKDSTGSFQAGLYFLAACSFACAVITFFAARASGEPGAVKRGNAAQPAE